LSNKIRLSVKRDKPILLFSLQLYYIKDLHVYITNTIKPLFEDNINYYNAFCLVHVKLKEWNNFSLTYCKAKLKLLCIQHQAWLCQQVTTFHFLSFNNILQYYIYFKNNSEKMNIVPLLKIKNLWDVSSNYIKYIV